MADGDAVASYERTMYYFSGSLTGCCCCCWLLMLFVRCLLLGWLLYSSTVRVLAAEQRAAEAALLGFHWLSADLLDLNLVLLQV